ncbi:hypothetical protein SAMN03159496_05036 [Rhizobium sp. NFR07]|nr:hypothetical protein SAMN03159496_05036 [Rhizobium sp. NFR07]
MRIAPISAKRALENVRPYLISLIIYRKRSPIMNGRRDWAEIGEARGIADPMTANLKKQMRPALDATMRWLKVPPILDDMLPAKSKPSDLGKLLSQRMRIGAPSSQARMFSTVSL